MATATQTSQISRTDLQPGDVVRYQRENQPDEQLGTVESVKDYSVTLTNGEVLIERDFVTLEKRADGNGHDTYNTSSVFDAEKMITSNVISSKDLNALRKSARLGHYEVKCADAVWHRRRIPQNGCINYQKTSFPCGGKFTVGQMVYVSGNFQRICVFDPVQLCVHTLESPAMRRANGKGTKSWKRKQKKQTKEPQKQEQVRDEDAGEYSTGADDDAAAGHINAQEALDLVQSLKGYLDGLAHKIRQGQTAAQELMDMAQATDVGNNKDEERSS